MEPRCSWCGAGLPHLYLFACGELACPLHVLSPYCVFHSDQLLVAALSQDQEIAHLLRMSAISGRENFMPAICRRVKEMEKLPALWKCTCGYAYNLSTKSHCDYCKVPRCLQI